MVVLESEPLGGLPAVRPEFRAYSGQQVKQADVMLLTYPWEFPQPAEVDRSNLDYYTPRYGPDGPAMTDSVNSIIAAELGIGCSAWTYTLRSLDPFVKAPYEQFTEARSGQGVFTFLTGEGGFLQEFLYGYTGLRWREDRLRLDPMLPPQLATVSAGAPLTVPTRTAGPDDDNLARCRPVTANAADPSAPAVAAVDGSTVTAWTPGTDPATPSTLTVRLAVIFEAVAGDAVRLRIPATRFGGENPKLAELAVAGP